MTGLMPSNFRISSTKLQKLFIISIVLTSPSPKLDAWQLNHLQSKVLHQVQSCDLRRRVQMNGLLQCSRRQIKGSVPLKQLNSLAQLQPPPLFRAVCYLRTSMRLWAPILFVVAANPTASSYARLDATAPSHGECNWLQHCICEIQRCLISAPLFY
jgi:hypothetical protein